MSMTRDWACLILRLWWVSSVPLVRFADICSRLRQTRQMDRAHQLRLQMGRLFRPCSSEMVHSNRKRWATDLNLVASTENTKRSRWLYGVEISEWNDHGPCKCALNLFILWKRFSSQRNRSNKHHDCIFLAIQLYSCVYYFTPSLCS